LSFDQPWIALWVLVLCTLAAPSLALSEAAPLDHRSRFEQAWFEGGASLGERALNARRVALSLGIRNADAAARALIAAESSDEKRLSKHLLAVRLAPDLPVAWMGLAREKWRNGDYRETISLTITGLIAIPRNLEASVWLVGSSLLMIAVVLISSSLVFIFAVAVGHVRDLAHDLGDLVSSGMPGFSRAAFLAALLLLPLALGEGLMGLALTLFGVGIVYGSSRHRMAISLAAALLIIGIYPMLQAAGLVLDTFEADPVATASLAVVQGTVGDNQLEILRAADADNDLMAKQMLAVHARRIGNLEEARARNEALVRSQGGDPLALVALGKMAFDAGNTDNAIAYFEKAQALHESPLLYFDLSQAYARAFRMEDYEYSMSRAQELGAKQVFELSRMGDTDFVVDMPYPIAPIRNRMLAAADGRALSDKVAKLLAPGLLGRSWVDPSASFLLLGLIGVVLAGKFEKASVCTRCGKRICGRCDDGMWSSDLCDGCHHLYNRPQNTDPDLRVARLQELANREARLNKVRLFASLIVPGASGLIARRPDLGFVGILFFAAAAVFFVFSRGIVPDPLAVGTAGTLAFILMGCVMTALYAIVLVSGLLIRRSSRQ
jgi:tetratricopeptide (TPR) repeat protein